jgi:hypothetical protein
MGDLADEFVAEDALEAHVALGDLQVGGANAGLADADDALAGGVGLGVARAEGEGLVENEGAHGARW